MHLFTSTWFYIVTNVKSWYNWNLKETTCSLPKTVPTHSPVIYLLLFRGRSAPPMKSKETLGMSLLKEKYLSQFIPFFGVTLILVWIRWLDVLTIFNIVGIILYPRLWRVVHNYLSCNFLFQFLKKGWAIY